MLSKMFLELAHRTVLVWGFIFKDIDSFESYKVSLSISRLG